MTSVTRSKKTNGTTEFRRRECAKRLESSEVTVDGESWGGTGARARSFARRMRGRDPPPADERASTSSAAGSPAAAPSDDPLRPTSRLDVDRLDPSSASSSSAAHRRQIAALLRRDDAWRTGALARLAATRGLADASARRLAWPRLLGIDLSSIDHDAYDAALSRAHPDASVVDADVARSLWPFTDGWSDRDRAARRDALRRVIHAAVCAHESHAPRLVSYYQGFHDVASVLALVLDDERVARAACERLALFHLRDCTRPTLQPALDALELIPPLLRAVDPELHRHAFRRRNASASSSGLGTHFAVAWSLAWHLHGLGDGEAMEGTPRGRAGDAVEARDDAEDARVRIRAERGNARRLAVASRLVDAFLTSHPAFPLYVGCAAMRRHRTRLLKVGIEEPAELHQALVKLRPWTAAEEEWGSAKTPGTERGADDSQTSEGNPLASDGSDDSRLAASLRILDDTLATARAWYRAYPPGDMYRRARVEPPSGAATTVYPWPWLTNVAEDRDGAGASGKKGDERGEHPSTTSTTSSSPSTLNPNPKVCAARSPLPDALARGPPPRRGARDSRGRPVFYAGEQPWRRRESPREIASSAWRRARAAAPTLAGFFAAWFVATEFLAGDVVEATFVLRWVRATSLFLEIFADPIFPELFAFVARRAAGAAGLEAAERALVVVNDLTRVAHQTWYFRHRA
jgi:hypothetical protein